MKKVIAVLMVVVLMFSLTACGQNVKKDILGTWSGVKGSYLLMFTFEEDECEAFSFYTDGYSYDTDDGKGIYTIDEKAKTITIAIDGVSSRATLNYSYNNGEFELYAGNVKLEKSKG